MCEALAPGTSFEVFNNELCVCSRHVGGSEVGGGAGGGQRRPCLHQVYGKICACVLLFGFESRDDAHDDDSSKAEVTFAETQ